MTMSEEDKRIREYELLYIIPATYTDDEIGNVEGRVKEILEKHGASILSTVRLGKFRFAYPIKKVRHGHYVQVRLNAESQAVQAIEAALRISSEILRFIFVRADEVGSAPFEMVQFTEVNIDARDDRSRRRREGTTDKQKLSEIKSGVEALEGGLKQEDDEASTPSEPDKKEISDEELEKKIESALKDENA